MHTIKLDELVAERDEAQDKIDDLNAEIAKLTHQCMNCGNWHYPHCEVKHED